jgi:ATP-binding cassette subfamily F protein 3
VILVSHDRRLIEATADRLLLVADGHVKPFEGDLDDYRKFLLTGDNRPTRRPDSENKPEAKPRKEEQRRANAGKRHNLKPLKDKVEAAESQIATLNAEISKLDKALADPLLFANDPAKGSAVSKKRADAARRLEAMEKTWLAAQEEYDAAMAET